MIVFDTFSISTYLIAYITGAIQSLFLISYVWKGDEKKERKDAETTSILHSIQLLFNNMFSGLAFALGILMLDSSMYWIAGQWIYSDWKFHLPLIITGIILGIQYVGIMLKKVTIIDLLASIITILIIIITLRGLANNPSSLKSIFTDTLTIWLVTAAIYGLIKGTVEILRFRYRNFKVLKPLWDLTPSFNRFYSRKFNIIMWVYCLIQFMLIFNGRTILFW